MHNVVARRRQEQRELIATARRYVEDLATRVPVIAAAVAGSVARGDFNVWSDIDVVVVAQGLPERYPDRADLLMKGQPKVQPVGYTPDEFRAALVKRNALVVEAVERGIPLAGEEFLRDLREGPSARHG